MKEKAEENVERQEYFERMALRWMEVKKRRNKGGGVFGRGDRDINLCRQKNEKKNKKFKYTVGE